MSGRTTARVGGVRLWDVCGWAKCAGWARGAAARNARVGGVCGDGVRADERGTV